MYTFSAFASIFHPAAWETDKIPDVSATVLDHEMTSRVKIKIGAKEELRMPDEFLELLFSGLLNSHLIL